jgi:hypothetical protein
VETGERMICATSAVVSRSSGLSMANLSGHL